MVTQQKLDELVDCMRQSNPTQAMLLWLMADAIRTSSEDDEADYEDGNE
jgi:hypothetical protein